MTFIVHATKPAIVPAMPKLKLEAEDSSPALKGKRDVFSTEAGGFVPINIYEFERLRPGNVVARPAIIEVSITMYIPQGQIGRVDEYRNSRVTEA